MSTEPTPVVGRARGSSHVRVGRGVFRVADTDDVGRASLRAWQLTLPDHACFAHLTAAAARGWWLPPLPDDLPTFVACRRGEGSTIRAELRLFRQRARPPRELIDGLWLASPVETALTCARDLCLLDLVVLLDCLLHTGACTLADLLSAASAHRRGAPALRAALALVDARSESPWESVLRVLHVTCGIEVEPQHEVITADGGFVARGDLWLVGTTTLHEYDGGEHLQRRRQRADLRRTRRIDDNSWTRRGYTDDDVLRRAVTILRDADASIGRVHDPGRIRAWNALLRESLFTPAGTTRLRRRLGLGDREPAKKSVELGPR